MAEDNQEILMHIEVTACLKALKSPELQKGEKEQLTRKYWKPINLVFKLIGFQIELIL